MHPRPIPAVVMMFLQLGLLSLAVHAKEKCNDTTEYEDDGKCCNKCPPGTSMTKKCEGSKNSSCAKCEDGYYNHEYSNFHPCEVCASCSVIGQVEVKSCTKTSNRVCACPNGTHEVTSGELKLCCSNCSPGEKITKECGVDLRTNCTPCDDETYSNGSGICIPCTKCESSEYEILPCAKTNDRRCEPKERVRHVTASKQQTKDDARVNDIVVFITAAFVVVAGVIILYSQFKCRRASIMDMESSKTI
uniref:Tumor necrosis factor receptor superfamily member 4-like n=1 Tax=Petromyzon marinus TaxID=7757 RepID=A0AAJ7X862_PETMA|nr:tumor necrosis factor receptor superfamily member 4-like [Petromyzon marinus]